LGAAPAVAIPPCPAPPTPADVEVPDPEVSLDDEQDNAPQTKNRAANGEESLVHVIDVMVPE